MEFDFSDGTRASVDVAITPGLTSRITNLMPGYETWDPSGAATEATRLGRRVDIAQLRRVLEEVCGEVELTLIR